MRVARKLPSMLNGPRRKTRSCSQRAGLWPTATRMQMTYKVVIVPSMTRTRVLVTEGPDELLRAVLPSSSQLQHERATITFLESLALWLNAKLHVLLSVGAKGEGFCLGLTQETGIGVRALYADVEICCRH